MWYQWPVDAYAEGGSSYEQKEWSIAETSGLSSSLRRVFRMSGIVY